MTLTTTALSEDVQNCLSEPLLPNENNENENKSKKSVDRVVADCCHHSHDDNNNNDDDSDSATREDYVLISTEDDDCYTLDPQRYAVLTFFSLCNLVASAEWITFAPIEDAVMVRYGGISPLQVNWLSMIFMALYGPGSAICSWSIRRFGLRETVVVSGFLVALGSVLRWWSIYFVVAATNGNNNNSSVSDASSSSGLAYAILLTGQGIVAMGQPVFSNAPARVASAWFQQTTEAIGAAVFAGMIGMVLGQAMSPFFVEESNGDNLDKLLAGQAIASVLCAIGTWWTFQADPIVPPTAAEAARRRLILEQEQGQSAMGTSSSSSSTSQVWKDVWKLATDLHYMILLVAFGVGYGVNNAILTLLQPWFAAAGFPGDGVAGLIGSVSMIGGLLGTLIAAPLLDASRNYTQAVRWSFAVAYLVAVAVVGTMRPACPVWLLAIACTAMGMSQFPLLPICMDAAAAHTYPIPEELSSAGLQLVGQYLGIVMIDTMGKLLENGRSSIGYTGPFNVAFLVLMGISAAFALFYSGDDPRATANHTGNHNPNEGIASATTTPTTTTNTNTTADTTGDSDSATDEENPNNRILFSQL